MNLGQLFNLRNKKRAKVVVSRVLPYLTRSNNILDIGSGTGDVANELIKHDKKVTALDVADYHVPRVLKTIYYDGKTIPFKDKNFDASLLLMVLHHTSDPELVLSEAARVGKEVIVIETSYTTILGKIITVIVDTLSNVTLKANWNSYKTDAEWQKIFINKGLKIKDTQQHLDSSFGFSFLHLVYYLTKQKVRASSIARSRLGQQCCQHHEQLDIRISYGYDYLG